MLSLILVLGFLGLLAIGAEIAMAMLIPTIICLAIGGYPLVTVAKVMAKGAESFPLMAVPFFIMAGNIMNAAGVTDRIFRFAQSLVGHIRGGLAQVNIVTSMIFAGTTGAAVAECAGLGVIQMKAMTEHGYERSFSAAVTVAAATLGPIFPPSVIFIIYAIQAQVSIARMFIAGVLPAFVICFLLMGTIYGLALFGRIKAPVVARASVREVISAFIFALPTLMVPVIILAGLAFGVVTPTETGILAIVYSSGLGIVYGNLRLSTIYAVLEEAALSTAAILFIIAVATVMGWIIAVDGTPTLVANAMLAISHDKIVLLLLINVLLLAVGCVLEGIPALIILVPILLPVTNMIGVDPIQFGVIISLNLVIGLATPPVGVSLFIMARIGRVPFDDVVRAIVPLLVPLILSLLIITYVPQLSLLLPDIVMGR